MKLCPGKVLNFDPSGSSIMTGPRYWVLCLAGCGKRDVIGLEQPPYSPDWACGSF